MGSLRGLIFGGLIGGGAGLLMGILIGVLVFGGLSFVQYGGVNVPYNLDHLEISKGFTVHDLTDGMPMNAKHVFTGSAVYHAFARDVFTPKTSYTQSLWIWTTGDSNDIEVTMTIWGPGEDGKSYLIEFGKHAGNAIQIIGFGQSVTWQKDTNEGYWSLTVTLS